MHLAEFKRTIKEGDYLTLLSHKEFPANRLIGQRRQVAGKNTVDILIHTTKPDGSAAKSHLGFPKASEFFHEGETLVFSTEGNTMHYRWERT